MNNLTKFFKPLAPILIICFVQIASSAGPGLAQCSCGGPPLLGSLESGATSAGAWRFGITYEYSSVGDFVNGTTELDDDIRDRNVNSALFQIDYGLTGRISLSAIFTALQQDRTTVSPTGSGEFLRASGVGDGIFLIKYNLFPFSIHSHRQLSIGAGVKAPLGKTSLLNPNGTVAAADMQPGSGAWDAVIWGSFSQGFLNSKRATLFSSATYRITDTNDDFQGGYRFGNEFVGNLGLSYNLNSTFSPDIGLRYRSAGAQRRADNRQPNSGGQWLNLSPGLSANISEIWSAKTSAQIPLYRDLDGTQYTTSFSFSISIFYSISPQRESVFESH